MTVIYRHRKTADTIQIHGSLKQLIQISFRFNQQAEDMWEGLKNAGQKVPYHQPFKSV